MSESEMTKEQLDRWETRISDIQWPEGELASFLTVAQLLQLIAKARKGLELEKDKERLDWLEQSSMEQVQITALIDGGFDLTHGPDEGISTDGDSLRTAIDAAMQKEKKV